MKPTADAAIARKISRLYLLALTAVAVLSVGGQVLVQRSLIGQQSDSKVINIAGRQRMLSQKISKTVLLLQNQPAQKDIPVYLSDLTEALELWQASHQGLQKGYVSYIKVPVTNSDTIRAMFRNINPLFTSIYKSAAFVSAAYALQEPLPPAVLETAVRNILQSERAYLKAMDRIVLQYDTEAAQRVNNSRHIEHILLFCTLVVLLMEGLFVFMPAVSQLRQTINQLINSKKETQQANAELVQVNLSLQETREALLEATNQKYQREINEQKLRSAYLVEGQEEERKRVAREIHDGLGQMLTALKYGIEKISDGTPPSPALAHLQQLVSQIITEARGISFDLMPAVLSDFGISSGLKLLAAQTKVNTGSNVLFTGNLNGERFAKNIEIGMYRVAQEAIHNAVKYAGAQEIAVELWQKKKYLHLLIKDNGHGFSVDALPDAAESTSLAHGISNMKERAFIINGKITICSEPGKGTRIHLKIPREQLHHEQN